MRIWLIGGGVAAVAGAAAAFLLLFAPEDMGPPIAGTVAGFEMERVDPAPEISFFDADGNHLSLADFEGRVVLLNLWATWCPPCVAEMPALDRLDRNLEGEPFEVVALSLDREGPEKVQPFYEELDLTSLGVYLDPSNAALGAFRGVGLPTTFLIDAEGAQIGLLQGPADWDAPEAEALIRWYLPAEA